MSKNLQLSEKSKVLKHLLCFFLGHEWTLLPIQDKSKYHNTGCSRCELRLLDLFEMTSKGVYERIDKI